MILAILDGSYHIREIQYNTSDHLISFESENDISNPCLEEKLHIINFYYY